MFSSFDVSFFCSGVFTETPAKLPYPVADHSLAYDKIDDQAIIFGKELKSSANSYFHSFIITTTLSH
jgi:hypothetical protein